MAELSPATSESRPGLAVLVVDDDRDAADSLAILLRLWGHRPRVAYKPEAAVLAVTDEPPDVVLMDLGLPGKDGFKLAADLSSRPGMGDATFVAITGHTHLARRPAETGRFLDVLIKPVEPEILRALLAGHQAMEVRAG